jgi:hypothetical protein
VGKRGRSLPVEDDARLIGIGSEHTADRHENEERSGDCRVTAQNSVAVAARSKQKGRDKKMSLGSIAEIVQIEVYSVMQLQKCLNGCARFSSQGIEEWCEVSFSGA